MIRHSSSMELFSLFVGSASFHTFIIEIFHNLPEEYISIFIRPFSFFVVFLIFTIYGRNVLASLVGDLPKHRSMALKTFHEF